MLIVLDERLGPDYSLDMPATNSHRAALAIIDREIALLIATRRDAACDGELDMINDAIDAARAHRRAMCRTR